MSLNIENWQKGGARIISYEDHAFNVILCV